MVSVFDTGPRHLAPAARAADDDRAQPSTPSAFQRFVELIARLRAPGGCPWDREQTHASLKPMTIEEAYEVLEAIDEGDDGELAGELGDLLLQVVFHAQIAADEARFTIDDVIDARVARRWCAATRTCSATSTADDARRGAAQLGGAQGGRAGRAAATSRPPRCSTASRGACPR